MIYTTYFENLKNLPEHITPIAICLKSPEWYRGLEYKKLAPHESFFRKWKANHDNNYYITSFNQQVLQNLSVEEVIEDLNALIKTTANRDIALICYELPGEFCHRHLVSQWLNKHNVFCIEWEKIT